MKVNVADESESTPEAANVTAKHLIDHLEDGYKSYACIYVGKNVESAAEVWSGVWNKQTTTLTHMKGLKIPKTGGKQACAATSMPHAYCIDSGYTNHCSPVCLDFTLLFPMVDNIGPIIVDGCCDFEKGACGLFVNTLTVAPLKPSSAEGVIVSRC